MKGILHFIAFIRPIVFHVFAWFKLILLIVEYLLYLIKLSVYGLLTMTADHGGHLLVLTLLPGNAIDGVATHGEEHKTRQVKEEELLKDSRPPDVNALGSRLDQKLAIEPLLEPVTKSRLLLLLPTIADKLVQVISVILRELFGIGHRVLIAQVLLSQSLNVN